MHFENEKIKNQTKLLKIYNYYLKHPQELGYIREWCALDTEIGELEREVHTIINKCKLTI